MKWLSSVHKATQRFLNSQRYHLRGGYRSRFFHASNPKPDQIRSSSSLYSGHYYSTSTILNVTESSSDRWPESNKIDNNVKKVDLEIISRETVKPSSPTPQHLRTFNFSIIDQFMLDMYTPLILFLPNTDKASVSDVVIKRSKLLKDSLSKILTRFYPFAGKVKNTLHIECNDEGIYYAEARVNQTLEEFLGHPDDDESVRGLVPESPCTVESSKRNYVIGVQVNIFKCGGIALSTSLSHKIFDGHTYYMFMKAWAAAARGSPETVSPSFVASEIFPHNPCLENSMPSKLLATKRGSTKRFVFDSTALALLKAQPVASVNSTHPP
ncbi:putative vinorine synthase [Helianthus annuus]|nr:putative vinorine synthase [Helianthus annuus]KAJ0782224.1 putative vinorine synthase [Helianthus annuus]